jgi:hypothetical protein
VCIYIYHRANFLAGLVDNPLIKWENLDRDLYIEKGITYISVKLNFSKVQRVTAQTESYTMRFTPFKLVALVVRLGTSTVPPCMCI